MSEHIHDCPTEGCNGYTVCSVEGCGEPQDAACRECLLKEVARLRGIIPELPPRPPEGEGLPRYGLRWNGPDQPVAVPMPDGYWTPWHLAEEARKELEERWGAEVGHANRHWQSAQDLRGAFAEFERRERHHALYNNAWLEAVKEGASTEEAHKAAQKACQKASKP